MFHIYEINVLKKFLFNYQWFNILKKAVDFIVLS